MSKVRPTNNLVIVHDNITHLYVGDNEVSEVELNFMLPFAGISERND